MPNVIITDASCLILPERINELELLRKVFGKVITTQTIAGEFGMPLPEWITVRHPQNKSNQLILELSLNKGEASAIALNFRSTIDH